MPLPVWVAEGAPGLMAIGIAAIGYVWYLCEKKVVARRHAEREAQGFDPGGMMRTEPLARSDQA